MSDKEKNDNKYKYNRFQSVIILIGDPWEG